MQDSPPGLLDPALELEAIAFAEGARQWLDYGIGGMVMLPTAVDAARKLLERSSRFLTVAA